MIIKYHIGFDVTGTMPLYIVHKLHTSPLTNDNINNDIVYRKEFKSLRTSYKERKK